jgi:2-oxoglutarate dehydrogenase E1 component
MATKVKKAVETNGAAQAVNTERRAQTFDVFRRWGYLQTQLDPLGQYLPPEPFPATLPEGEDDAAAEARAYYCGTIGVEFMHIPNAEKREWLESQMERTAPAVDQKKILTGLIKADIFEQVAQSRYLGTKRFSLEGLTVLIPFLDRIFEVSTECGVTTGMVAMSHRGRLNVMVNTIGRTATDILRSSRMWTRARPWAAAM